MFGFNLNKIQRSPNTENSEKENSKENKKEKIVLEIDGQKIEGEKYYFEYTKNIQEETGILGYERTKIDSEEVFAFVKEKLLQKNIELPDSINSMESWGKEVNKKQISGQQIIKWETEKIANDICIEILSQLSHSEYPMETINHQISGYAFDSKEIHAKDFIDHKFFLQKLYDADLIMKNDDDDRFNHKDSQTVFDIFDKKTNKLIASKVGFHRGYISNSAITDFQKSLENNEVYITTGDTGLNFSAGSFFTRSINNIGFGFSNTESIFEEYLTKIIDIYNGKLKNEKGESLFYKNEIKELIQTFIFNQTFLKKFLASNVFQDAFGNNPSYEETEEYELLIKNTEDFINTLSAKYNLDPQILYEKEMMMRKSKSIAECIIQEMCWYLYNAVPINKNYFSASDMTYHIYMPILINNDEVLQLQWGHAKYAHYFNEKGFNFFKFKHADHLPEPKSEAKDNKYLI